MRLPRAQPRRMHHQRAGGLGHRLHDQHARHHRDSPGKWPWKYGSLTLTAFQPVALSNGTMSVSRSTNRNGARCGSSFLICSISRTDRVISHGRPACGGWARRFSACNLPQPFSYRFRRHAAIILSARQMIWPDTMAGARRQPGAGADMDMIGDARPARPARRNPRSPSCPPRRPGPTSTQWRPICTLWPIWTRLSILVPSPITVSPSAPRSMVVPAPISTPSWMMTRPSCGILTWPLAR